MNLNQITSPYQGKKLGKSQLNLLVTLAGFGVTMPESREIRTNPFSGVSKELDPLAVALYDFVVNTRNPGFGPLSFGRHKVAVGIWDRARYLFLALWPDEYYDLLD